MKLIGVMGNSGSGKTTFTDYLASKKTVGVIHVDELVGQMKRKYFRPFLQPEKNNTTESTKKNPKLNINIKEFFYKNKFTFKFLMFVRSKLLEGEINKKIYELKLDGKRVILIDDWALPTHKNLIPKLNQIYFLKRGIATRRDALRERDELTKHELRVYDIPYATKNIDIPKNAKVSVIYNNGSFEELFQKAEEEYERIGELSFDERYSIKGKANVRVAAEKLRKAAELNKQNRINTGKENRQIEE